MYLKGKGKVMLTLSNLTPNDGSNHRVRRLGRSGKLGKTSGKGHKGQKARKGKNLPFLGFQGGQTPLYRSLPKRGFSSRSEVVQICNIKDLSKFQDGDLVDIDGLFTKGIISTRKQNVKILGDGVLSKKLKVSDKRITLSREATKKLRGVV